MENSKAQMRQIRQDWEDEATLTLERLINITCSNLSDDAIAKIIDARIGKITRCRYLNDVEKILQYRRLVDELEGEIRDYENIICYQEDCQEDQESVAGPTG